MTTQEETAVSDEEDTQSEVDKILTRGNALESDLALSISRLRERLSFVSVQQEEPKKGCESIYKAADNTDLSPLSSILHNRNHAMECAITNISDIITKLDI